MIQSVVLSTDSPRACHLPQLYKKQCNMKKITLAVLSAATLICAPVASANPDIKDLLRGLGTGTSSNTEKSETGGNGSTSTVLSGLQGLVEGLISNKDLTEADLVGTYAYSAPAVAFQSDNLLQKAGGAAAAGVIENKIAPYYEKVGINQMTATFNEDQTFRFTIKRVNLSGTFEKNTEGEAGDFIFKFTAAGRIPVGQFAAHVEKVGSKLTITFDATKLITLINQIATISGQKSLQGVASLLNSYDGLNCGFELSKVQ